MTAAWLAARYGVAGARDVTPRSIGWWLAASCATARIWRRRRRPSSTSTWRCSTRSSDGRFTRGACRGPVATAEQFSAFLLRRHHLHPEHRLVGPPGVLAALELLQGDDVPLRVWEQDLLSARVEDYRREWLDRLGLGGEIVWTVFEPSGGERARAARRAWRSATTSAGCARPASVPRSMRAPRTCCCTCSCAAPRSRAISRDRPASTRRGPWPRCGSCSGRVWRRPTRSARSWPPGRHRAAAASARRVRRRPRRGQARGVLAHLPARRALERARRGGAALTRGARGGARPAAAGPLRRGRARAGARRLGRAPPHAAADGVRRRRRARLLRRGALRRAVCAAGGAHRSGRAAHAPGRAARAGESRRPGQPLGARVAAGASSTARA